MYMCVSLSVCRPPSLPHSFSSEVACLSFSHSALTSSSFLPLYACKAWLTASGTRDTKRSTKFEAGLVNWTGLARVAFPGRGEGE